MFTVSGSSEHWLNYLQTRRFYNHKSLIPNLKENTKYYYRVGCSKQWSDEYHFTTLAQKSGVVRFAVFGDLGLVNARVISPITEETTKKNFDMIIHVGDIGYNMEENESRLGDNFMQAIQPIAAYTPYQVCPGNHEVDLMLLFYNYRHRFFMPGTSSNMYYSYDVGPVHFVAISTEHYFFFPYDVDIGVQFEWLIKDLEKANHNRNKVPWIIVYGHRPFYCSDLSTHKHGSPRHITNKQDCIINANKLRNGVEVLGTRKWGLEQLFNEMGVDMYICGHEHSYERLWPVYDGIVHNGTLASPYTNPTAPVHIITGSAGNRENLDSFGPSLGPWSAFRSATYGYGRMNVFNSTHIHFEQILADKGTVLDEFWLIQEIHGPFTKM